MTRLTRRVIFYFLILIFILAAPATILYASGFSFDWQNWQLLKTGSFYFDSLPKEAKITIEGKQNDITPAYIGRLLPRRYAIEISQDGYENWHKNLDIFPQATTEARSIFLAPKEPKIAKTADNVTSTQEYFLNEDQKTVQQKILQNASSTINNAASWMVFKNELYYLQKSNMIFYKAGPLGQIIEQISTQSLPEISKQYQIKVSDENSAIFIPGGKLFLLNNQTKTFDFLADNIMGAEFSSDNEKLLFWTSHEIWILWFTDVWSQPYRKSGEKELITRLSDDIGRVIWFPLTNEHIIYTVRDSNRQEEQMKPKAPALGAESRTVPQSGTGAWIKITELDGRDQRNTYDIYSGNISEIYFNLSDNLLYFLTDNKLYFLDLLPK